MSETEAGKVLLACLNVAQTQEQREKLKTTPLDVWTRVVDLALHHGVGSLLHSNLKKSDLSPLLPANSAERLRNAHRSTTGKNLRLNYELKTLLGAFAAKTIPVIVLKGAYLANVVYSSTALRTMIDIDILVHEDHLPQAAQILQDLGYLPEKPIQAPNEAAHHLPKFIHRETASVVEIHWQLFHKKPLDAINTSGIWERAMPMTLVDSAALALAPEDLLLHLCCHAVYEHYLNQDMRFLVDIAMTVEHFHETFEWQTFAARAHSWHCSRGVYLALFLAQELLGVNISPAVFEALVPQPTDEIPVEAFLTLYFTSGRTQFQATSISFAELLSTERLVDKLRLIWRRVILPRKRLAILYGVAPESPRIYIYYVVHVIDLINRYFKKLRHSEPALVTQFQLQQELLHWAGIEERE